MDLTTLPPKAWGKIVEFGRINGSLWAKILDSPSREIAGLDLTAPDAGWWLAIQFALFVLCITFALEVPVDVAFLHLQIEKLDVLSALVMLDLLGIGLIGPFLYFSAKMVWGKGRFSTCMLTGLYVSAFLPIAELPDYLAWANPYLRHQLLSGKLQLPQSHADIGVLVLWCVVGTGVYLWLLVKMLPVIRRLHSFGWLRTLLSILIGVAMYSTVAQLFFFPIFSNLVEPVVASRP